jgi:hypothetical protein
VALSARAAQLGSLPGLGKASLSRSLLARVAAELFSPGSAQQRPHRQQQQQQQQQVQGDDLTVADMESLLVSVELPTWLIKSTRLSKNALYRLRFVRCAGSRSRPLLSLYD